jgi:hypothetical protein
MADKKVFGGDHSKEFEVGDLVEWSTWSSKLEKWVHHYGILLKINNEIRSNRLVSISKVMPVNSTDTELEFFTMSLRPALKGENITS